MLLQSCHRRAVVVRVAGPVAAALTADEDGDSAVRRHIQITLDLEVPEGLAPSAAVISLVLAGCSPMGAQKTQVS